jgi:hypothetical protein
MFEDYKTASAKLFQDHGKEAYMSRKLPGLIVKALPQTPMEIFRIDDRPEGDYSEYLSGTCEGGQHCLRACYYGKESVFIKKAIERMSNYLNSMDVSFVPPGYVIAHVPKL